MKGKPTKWVTWCMALVMFFIGVTPGAYADFSPSELTGLSPMEKNSDSLEIQKVLESKMIRERLRQLGFPEEGIQGRLNQLSDQQIHQMSQKIDELRVGGDATALLVALFIVLLVSAIAWFSGMRME